MGDEREHQRALAHAELVGELAQAMALDGERLEPPGLLLGRHDIGEDQIDEGGHAAAESAPDPIKERQLVGLVRLDAVAGRSRARQER
ncbi:hypothetical protein D3C87_2019380 [compost metagenome]